MKWKRPSGTEIETLEDDVTITQCKSMGWEPVVKGNKKITAKGEPNVPLIGKALFDSYAPVQK